MSVSSVASAISRTSSLLVLLAAALLLAPAARAQTPCTYYGSRGSCIATGSCAYAFSPSISGVVTGCEREPADIQCCAQVSCTHPTGDGTCRKDSKPCSGQRISSSGGAMGCRAFPPDVRCCVTSSGNSGPTPTPSPTPSPTPRLPSGPTPCRDEENLSGTCLTVNECTGKLSTRSNQGANGCQSLASSILCCSEPSCSFQSTVLGTVRGVCTENSKACGGSRKTSGQGANGCRAYRADVTCCLSQFVPDEPENTPAPTPQPGPTPCRDEENLSGTCRAVNACSGKLSTATSQGASGCQSLASNILCCTEPSCSFQSTVLGTVRGVCTENGKSCGGSRKTSGEGANGCRDYRSDVTCCLSQFVPAEPDATPAPTPPITQAPTPVRDQPPPDTTCRYFQNRGQCALGSDCPGAITQQSEGARGCDETIENNGCCIQAQCTHTDAQGTRQGICRPRFRCNDERMESLGVGSGAEGCSEVFGAGVECCVQPRQNSGGNDPPPSSGDDTPLELTCTMRDGRVGTCYPPDNCEGQFFPPQSAEYTGCRNQARFSGYGCCVSPLARPPGESSVGKTCSLENSDACDTGTKCRDVGDGMFACLVDDAFDCKKAEGCLVAGQECAEDGPDGSFVCGAPRTCRVLDCPQGKQCTEVGTGNLPQCIGQDGECRNCAFNEECRQDTRGPSFPAKCAPKGALTVNSGGDNKGPAEDEGMPTWLLALIIAVVVVVCLVLCCIIAACVVASSRDDDTYDVYNVQNSMYGNSMNGTPMQNVTPAGAYPSGVAGGQSMHSGYSQGGSYGQGETFATASEFGRPGTGGDYTGANYPQSMGSGYSGGSQGDVYPSARMDSAPAANLNSSQGGYSFNQGGGYSANSIY